MSKPKGAMSASDMLCDLDDPKLKFKPLELKDVKALLKDYKVEFVDYAESDNTFSIKIEKLI